MTGIDVMRDSVENINNTDPDHHGYKGDGIKVGVADRKFADPDNVDYLNPVPGKVHYNVDSDDLLDTHSTHGSLVACLIAGQYVDADNPNVTYYGAVPNAELFLSSAGNMYERIEYLMNKEIRACLINRSDLYHFNKIAIEAT